MQAYLYTPDPDTLLCKRPFFSEIPLHPVFKPALGGLAVGAIGLFYPRVLGMGYDVIMDALNNQFTFKLLLILLFLKILAFSLTLASGGREEQLFLPFLQALC